MLQGKHILRSFDKDLSRVNNCLINMTQIIIDELYTILSYFNTKDASLIDCIGKQEEQLNKTNQQVLYSSLEIFTLRSPVASDLRYVFAGCQIARSLEYNGDQIKKAIRDIHGLTSRDHDLDKLVVIMLEKNINMHNIALNAFIKQDTSLAIVAEINDDGINEAFSNLCNLLLQKIQKNPEKLSSFYNYLFLGRRLEQIGDHVYNIRSLISFIETGLFKEKQGVFNLC